MEEMPSLQDCKGLQFPHQDWAWSLPSSLSTGCENHTPGTHWGLHCVVFSRQKDQLFPQWAYSQDGEIYTTGNESQDIRWYVLKS